MVYFLRKPYNDEHFDLESISRLTGKTIYFASLNAQNCDPILKNSLMVIELQINFKIDYFNKFISFSSN